MKGKAGYLIRPKSTPIQTMPTSTSSTQMTQHLPSCIKHSASIYPPAYKPHLCPERVAIHQVQPGDTLERIAIMHNVTVSSLKSANNLSSFQFHHLKALKVVLAEPPLPVLTTELNLKNGRYEGSAEEVYPSPTSMTASFELDSPSSMHSSHSRSVTTDTHLAFGRVISDTSASHTQLSSQTAPFTQQPLPSLTSTTDKPRSSMSIALKPSTSVDQILAKVDSDVVSILNSLPKIPQPKRLFPPPPVSNPVWKPQRVSVGGAGELKVGQKESQR
jgi:LysM repeat protein